MVSVVRHRKESFNATKEALAASGIVVEIDSAEIDVSTPFLVSSAGQVLVAPNEYLRQRAAGRLYEFSARKLSWNSVLAYANDLAYFLNTYNEPTSSQLRALAQGQKLSAHYRNHLERPESHLSISTIERRHLVAKEFISFLNGSCDDPSEVELATKQRSRSLTNESNQKIHFSKEINCSARRRHPSLMHVLPPTELLKFFDSFIDVMLGATSKFIFGTGARRSEVARITAGAIARLQPLWPGGPAKLGVIGKGNKRRDLEVEPALQVGCKRLLTSPERIRRAKLWSQKYGGDPFGDEAPFFLNRFGEPLSGKAIGDGFLRASLRSGIKRSPHEIRHEFATAYLVNAYRTLANQLSRNGLDTWLARLMIEKADLAVIRLSQLLGHSNVETTKKFYLRMLIASEPSIRDAWCEHLDKMGLENLE